jgi:hypothetical protein
MALSVLPAALFSQTNSSFTVIDFDNVYNIAGHTVADIWFQETGRPQQHWPPGRVKIHSASNRATATVYVTPPAQPGGFLQRLLFLFTGKLGPKIGSGQLTGNLQNPKGGPNPRDADPIPFEGDDVVVF